MRYSNRSVRHVSFLASHTGAAPRSVVADLVFVRPQRAFNKTTLMATGPEMYDAVHTAIRSRRLSPGGEFTIHRLDATDLIKLQVSDLEERHFDVSLAEEIVAGLERQDYRPLTRTLGVTFVISDDEPSLLDN